MSENSLLESPDDPDEEEPPLSELLDALADRRRRRVLRLVSDHQTPLALSDLADEVAAAEHDCLFTDISEHTVKRTYTSLYHSHVPKLAVVGLLEYDQDVDAVAPGHNVEMARPYLDLAAEIED
ncbi:DUF7344 domain-containing protein [Halorussus halophilus]|uniref:DUF7344 domain-containing protein n=1 Tax=Halorussus halophilus TaxID=2650975 RepID=UPI0013013C8A|nr:hypothetical protein [Halorussus halophilus]